MKYRTVRIVDAPSLNKEVGKLIRRERKKRGLTQLDVGVHLGVTRASIANMESGSQAIMLIHIYNLALFFSVPVRRLLP